MIDEREFKRDFWREKFAALTRLNAETPNISTSKEEVISRLDQMAIEKGVKSFGHEEYFDSLRVSMIMDFGPGKKFDVEIRMQAQREKYKGAYLELNLMHLNEKEMLSNTFLPYLPFSAVEELLTSLKKIDLELEEKLTDFKKKMKMRDLNVSLIKSLLTEKFRNTSIDWNILEVGDGVSFKVILERDKQAFYSEIVTAQNCVEKITQMDGWG